jgi:hypothetical protein
LVVVVVSAVRLAKRREADENMVERKREDV